jgi:hypothetical protein
MHSISLAPLINLLVAYVLMALGVAIPIVGRKALSYLHVKLTDAQWAIVDRTAEKWAKQLIAQADASLMTKSITINNSAVADMAEMAVKDIPDVLGKLGLSPDEQQVTLREYIVKHIGGAQAASTTVNVPEKAA